MGFSFISASEVDPAKIYFLLQNIYESTPYFSDRFANKYPDQDAFRVFLSTFFSCPGSHFDLIVADSELVGYIQIERRSESNLCHTGYLNMGVHPQFQNRGLGRRLLDHGWQLVEKEPHIEILYLMTRSDNLSALNLYSRAGFEPIATLEKDTKTPDGKYYDGILMRKFTKNFPL